MTKSRFRIVERPSKHQEEPLERDLLSVDEFRRPAGKKAGWLSSEEGINRMVKVFIDAETAHPDDRTLRQAAFQNRILRAYFSGDLGEPAIFFDKFSKKIRTDDPVKNRYEDVRRVFIGIAGAINAVEKDRKGFERTPHPAERKQEILLNDYLDAKRAIDYIDLHYDTDDHGNMTRIIEVRLVQIKANKMSDEELDGIYRSHEYYLKELLDHESFIRRERAKAAEGHVASGEKIRQDMEMREFPGERLEYLFDMLDPILSRVVDMEESALSANQVKEWTQDRPEVVPVLAILLRQSNAYAEIKALLEFFTKTQQIDKAFNQLQAWAEGYQISVEEYVDLYPDWQVPPDVLAATKFVSVVRHADAIVEVPIESQQFGAKVMMYR